jgi:hypothetical protein
MAGASAPLPRRTFPVKVYLPKDITAILLCDQDTSVDKLLERSLDKLKVTKNHRSTTPVLIDLHSVAFAPRGAHS